MVTNILTGSKPNIFEQGKKGHRDCHHYKLRLVHYTQR